MAKKKKKKKKIQTHPPKPAEVKTSLRKVSLPSLSPRPKQPQHRSLPVSGNYPCWGCLGLGPRLQPTPCKTTYAFPHSPLG